MFQPAPNNVNFPDLEAEVLEFWKSKSIYHRSLDQRRESPSFVFYEGPPTANGMPHPGHCLTRAIKDNVAVGTSTCSGIPRALEPPLRSVSVRVQAKPSQS